MSMIHAVKRIFLLMMISWALCPAMPLCAQGVLVGGSNVIPGAPQSHVLDDAGLFREQPARLAEIEHRLRALERDHGYPVYLTIHYNVFDSDLQSRADRLYEAWIGGARRGMVIVYQLDPVVSGSNPAVSYYQGSELDANSGVGADGYTAAGAPSGIMPGRDVEALLARAYRAAADRKEDPKAFLDMVTLVLDREVRQYLAVAPPKWSDANNLKLMAVFLSVIAGLVLAGFLLWKLMSRADAKSRKTHYFPEVRVGRRLGAPYGGGWISEKTFVPASSRK